MSTISDISTLNKQRVAGILFLLTIIIPSLNWVFILSRFLLYDGDIALRILENEFLFRFNIINQIISSVCIMALGYLLYIILKPIEAKVSLLALFFKAFESIFTLILAIVYLIVLSMVKSGINEESLITGLISNYISYTAIPGLFLGISMMIFAFLFYKTDIIPKWLAILGVISYIIVILYDSSIILSPKISSLMIVQIIGSTPVGIFHLIIGFYLIFKKN